MILPYRSSILSLLFVILLISCDFRRIQRSSDWRVKYDAALAYYENEDYYRSALLFEDIRPIVQGLPEGENVTFYLAYCQYYEGTYLLASTQFLLFYETYGRSPMAEEANFMYAYCLYASAPDYNYDQSSTRRAMEEMQTFINRYPLSDFYEEAVNVINECQQKLERKEYENAKQYLRLRYYRAAIIAFDNFRLNFPDSQYLEELSYQKVLAQYELASQSIPSLREERYSNVIEFYLEFLDNYPNSEYLRDAEKYYSDSIEIVNQFKTDNS